MWISLWAALAVAAPLSAEERAAEQERALEELRHLAERQAWSGVERAWLRLEELEAEVPASACLLGAKVATQDGRIATALGRMHGCSEQSPQLEADLASLHKRFGRVKLEAHKGSTLVPDTLPFAQDARNAVVLAQQAVTDNGAFEGWLPVGGYQLGTTALSIAPGPATQHHAEAEPATPAVPRTSSGIAIGPLVVASAAGSLSPAPADTPPGQIQPATLAGVAPALTLGIELSGAQLGGLLALRVQPGLGQALDAWSGWAALVVHPGPLRVALGPTYALHRGRGEGVAPSVALGPDALPAETLDWSGAALAAGGRLAVGLRVSRLGPLSLTPTLTLGAASDGVRPYLDAGLGLALAPTPRRSR